MYKGVCEQTSLYFCVVNKNELLHLFDQPIANSAWPKFFPYPFYHKPDDLALKAAEQVKQLIAKKTKHDFDAQGKMFGVLVVEYDAGEVGYLMGYSGKLKDDERPKGFVPPVVDVHQKDSFFKVGEKVLDALTLEIDTLISNPDFIREEIIKGGYDLGISFDGDGDRILLVSSTGKILDGDDLLYILSKDLNKEGGVVGTLMTNKALELHFNQMNIEFCRSDVGDKYVLQKLLESNWTLGGATSGHIICLDAAQTGEAIVAALKLLDSLKENSFDVDQSVEEFNKFPQTLINLSINNPNKIILNDKFWSEVTIIEKKLGEKGRVLIRPSGTEPLIRIMVESENRKDAEDYSNRLADLASRL